MSISLVLIPIVIASVGVASLALEESGNKHLIVNTKMKNESILKEAMGNYGYKSKKNENNLKMFIENGEVYFRLNNENVFQAVFNENFSKAEAETIINEIYDEYTSIVQQETYEKILENIEEYKFKLTSEEVTEKNSIVLTLEL